MLSRLATIGTCCFNVTHLPLYVGHFVFCFVFFFAFQSCLQPSFTPHAQHGGGKKKKTSLCLGQLVATFKEAVATQCCVVTVSVAFVTSVAGNRDSPATLICITSKITATLKTTAELPWHLKCYQCIHHYVDGALGWMDGWMARQTDR